MDLAKYVAMLDRRSLFFARATLLDDPFEGSSPKMIAAHRKPGESRIFKDLVKNHLVNCWHMNEQESAAMWKLYSSSNEAVCIRSTYRRLRARLPQDVMIGEVKYINYETQWFNASQAFDYIMHKRLSFAHERELRAIIWDLNWVKDSERHNPGIEPSGLAFGVDLPALVERVYVSPTATSWFADLIRAITVKYGFAFHVSQSSLAETPLY
jgi:hypothetical protein